MLLTWVALCPCIGASSIVRFGDDVGFDFSWKTVVGESWLVLRSFNTKVQCLLWPIPKTVRCPGLQAYLNRLSSARPRIGIPTKKTCRSDHFRLLAFGILSFAFSVDFWCLFQLNCFVEFLYLPWSVSEMVESTKCNPDNCCAKEVVAIQWPVCNKSQIEIEESEYFPSVSKQPVLLISD